MQPIVSQIARVQQKLQQLLKSHQQLQKENAKLTAELEKMRNTTAVQTEQIQHLQQQLAVKNLQTGNWSEEEKKQLEMKVNAYLKEIDKCLNLLNA
jgi:chromosome segregation ATPase